MRANRGVGLPAILGAFALGSAATYWLDPETGRRRRGRARDMAVHLGCETRDLVGKGARDLRHRAAGAAAEMRHAVEPLAAGSADVLAARVRAEIGRICSHPHAIDVTADDEGRVALRGPVLASEADEVCARVARVRGVRELSAVGLERHDSAEGVPALQGNGARRSSLRRQWTPARQLLGGAAGAALVLAGLGRRRLVGRAMAFGGAALLARAATNVPPGKLFGFGPSRARLHLTKSILVDAPVEQVFAFIADVENFPRFIQHVRRVRRLGDGRSHWVVEGPAGIPVHWEAEVTRVEPNAAFAWKTTGSGAVHHSGVVRLEPADGHGTRIELRVSYEPVGGMVGYALAKLLGADPKRALDEDMLRFKSLLERGKTSAHGAAVSREQVSH